VWELNHVLCIIITAVCICVLIHNFPPFVLVQKDHLTICMLSPYYEKSPKFPAVLKTRPRARTGLCARSYLQRS